MAGCEEVYSVKLVYGELWKVLDGIDPDRYSLVVLKSDFTEVFMGDAHAWKAMDLELSYVVPSKVREKVVLHSDGDLIKMFSSYRGHAIVVVHCVVKENGVMVTPVTQVVNAARKKMAARETKNHAGIGNKHDAEMQGSTSLDDESDHENSDDEELLNVPNVFDDWKNYYTEYGSENEADDVKDIAEDFDGDFENESDNEGDYQPLRKSLSSTPFQLKEGENISFKEGTLFETQEDFKEALINYSIQEGFQIRYKKSCRKNVTAICKAAPCTWRIHASTLADKVTFSIKTLMNQHTCKLDNRIVAPLDWVAKKIMSTVKADRKVSINVLWEVLRKYGVQPNRWQMMRAKNKALEMIEGKHSDSFKLLPQYCIEVLKSNPGSLAKIQYCIEPGEDNSWLKRIFVGFNAAKKGFLEGCRPYLGFDGCHLKGRYGGVLLSAIANDPDGGFFPVAVAYVEGESKDSWSFFFNMLSEFFGGFDQNKEWTFMTDRQKGLEPAITDALPSAYQRRCSRHIYANFRKKNPALVMKKLFWNASMAYNVKDFNEAMENIKKLSVEAYEALEKIDKKLWARHCFSTSLRCANVTNNPSESFNNWLGHIRNLPLHSLLEELRCKMMCRLKTRYATSRGWSSKVCPRTKEILQIVIRQGRRLQVFGSSDTIFEVVDGQARYTVKLDRQTCLCGVWDHTGVPCKHAAAVLLTKGYDLEDYCDQMLTKEQFQKAYAYMINPVLHPSFWPQSDLSPCNPPKIKRRIGRPKTSRAKEDWEDDGMKRSSTHRCGICGEFGHNRLTCAGGLTAKEKKARKRKADALKNQQNQELHGDGSAQAQQPVRKRARNIKPKIPENNEEVSTGIHNAEQLGEKIGNHRGTSRKKLPTKRYPKKPVNTQPLLDTIIEQHDDIDLVEALGTEPVENTNGVNGDYAARTTAEKEKQILEENYDSTLETPDSEYHTTQEDQSQPCDKPAWENDQFAFPDDIRLDFEGLKVKALDEYEAGNVTITFDGESILDEHALTSTTASVKESSSQPQRPKTRFTKGKKKTSSQG